MVVPLLETSSGNSLPVVSLAMLCRTKRWQNCPRTESPISLRIWSILIFFSRRANHWLIVRHHDHTVDHQGRGFTLNKLWSSNYCVIVGSSVVGNYISKCITSRNLHDLPSEQKSDPTAGQSCKDMATFSHAWHHVPSTWKQLTPWPLYLHVVSPSPSLQNGIL